MTHLPNLGTQSTTLSSLTDCQSILVSLIESMEDAVFVKDLQGRYVLVNKMAAAILNKPADAMIGRTAAELMAEIYSADYVTEVLAEDRQLIASGVSLTVERAVFVRGSWCHYQAIKSVWRDAQGQPLGIISIDRDITERQETHTARPMPVRDEAALIYYGEGASVDITERKSVETTLQRYTDMLRLSYDAILVWSLKGGIEFWNRGAEALYGYKASEAIGQVSHQLLASTHPLPFSAILAELRRKGTWEGEIRHITKAGKSVIVSTRHQLMEDSAGDLVVLEINRDITAQKQAEAARRESEERFATFFRHSPSPIAILSLATYRYVDVNPAWVRNTGYTYAEAIQRTPAELNLQAEPRLHLLSLLRQAGAVADVEIQVQVRDGRVRTALMSGKLIQINDAPHALLVYADITERKQAEERLRFLAEASTMLASSLDYTLTLQNVAHAAVPGIADWCVIDLLDDDGSIRGAAIAHKEPAKVQWAEELRQRYPVDINAPLGAPNVMRTRQSEFYPEITDAMLQAAAKNSEELTLLRSVGYRSVMIVPLQTHGRVLGAITLVATDSERHFTPTDLTMAEELAQRAAAAIGNAQLHQAVQQREQLLRVSEERLRLATEAGRIGIYDHDLLTHRTNYSPIYQAITGIKANETLTLMAWLERVYPADRALVAEKLERAIVYGESYDYEYRIYRPDGELRWLGISSRVSMDESGRAIRLTGALSDITERKEAEEEIQRLNRDLKRRLDELQSLLDVAPIGIFVAHDAACTMITSNAIGAKMLGMAPASNTSKSGPTAEQLPFRVLRNGREVAPDEMPMQYAATHDIAINNWEVDVVHADGNVVNLYEYALPLHDEEGKVRGCLGIFVDITERKQTEVAMRASEERFRSAFEQAAVGMAHVSLDGHYVRVNNRLCTILGYSREELLQMNFLDLICAEDRAQSQALSESLLHGHIPSYTMEKRYLRRDGSPLWVNLTASIVRERDGEVNYRLAVIEDISSRKAAEAALHDLTATLEKRVKERTAELERSNQELDQFAYVASHDLKAPLRAIVNLAGWIAEDAGSQLPAPSQEHLTKLQERTLRMERLLDDLLTYSRAGRSDGVAEGVKTDLLVQDVIYLLAPPDGFTVAVLGEMPFLLTPRVPLELVFRNLIGNAIKHHHQPATGLVQISAQDRGDFVEFAIQDNGPGIEPEYHNRIFGMFQTLRPRDEVEGSGMGLAIVKRSVEYRGGGIWVESTLGLGTTFRFLWPKQVVIGAGESGSRVVV